MEDKERTRLIRRVTVLCALLAILIIVGSIVISLLYVKTSQTLRMTEDNASSILELRDFIQKLPTPIDGKDGIDGASIIGPQGQAGPKGDTVIGKNGRDGKDAKPCSTSTDDTGNTKLSCPDGTVSTIEKPSEGRSSIICLLRDGVLGWKFIGDTSCKKVLP